MGTIQPRIDVHAHYIPGPYAEMLKRRGIDKPDGFPMPQWSLESQFEHMDRLNIRYAGLTISSPHAHFGDAKESIETVHASNEEGLSFAKKHPDRLGLFATLPLPEVSAAVDEVEYGVAGGALGFVLPTHAQGVYIGDERLDPVFEALDRHGAVVCLHPTTPSAVPPNVTTQLPNPMMEFFFDTSRAVVNLILNGVVERYPNITFIVPHAGAVLPILSDRIDAFSTVFSPEKKPDIFGSLGRFYYDLAGIVEPKQLELLFKTTSLDHLLYGSDGPHTATKRGLELAVMLDESDKLTDAQRAAVYIDNANKLLDLQVRV